MVWKSDWKYFRTYMTITIISIKKGRATSVFGANAASRRALRGRNLGSGSPFDLNRPDLTSSPNKPLGAEAKSKLILHSVLYPFTPPPPPPFHPLPCKGKMYDQENPRESNNQKNGERKHKIQDDAFKTRFKMRSDHSNPACTNK